MRKVVLNVVAIVMVISVMLSSMVFASATDPDIYNGVDLSTNADMYGKAIWTNDVSYNETVMVHSQRGDIQLLYPIDSVVSVRSYDLQTVYEQGTDYIVTADGKLSIPKGSKITVYQMQGPNDLKNKTGNDTDWTSVSAWSSNSHKYQIQVTYTHSKTWPGTTYNTAPDSQLSKLTHFYNKAKSGQAANVVFYGDSITVGWNASGLDNPNGMSKKDNASDIVPGRVTMYQYFGYSSMPDWALKAYPVQVMDFLKKQFNNDKLNYISKAVSSSNSVWAANDANISYLLKDTNPDLCFIAFGMNEYNRDYNGQKYYVKRIIDYVRTLNPDCSIVLVSAFHPNIYENVTDETPSNFYLDEQESAYYSLASEYSNMVVAPVNAYSLAMTNSKEAYDFNSNIYNHPNDFGCRLYADVINAVLTEAEPTRCQVQGHGQTITVHASQANCQQEGYTGDTVCTVCNKTITVGEKIKKNDHIASDWIVDVLQGELTSGLKHKECIHCGIEMSKEVIQNNRNITFIERTGYGGDVDGNGRRDLMDLSMLAQFVAGWNGLSLVQETLNVDNDDEGKVDLNDIVYLARYLAGWEGFEIKDDEFSDVDMDMGLGG